MNTCTSKHNFVNTKDNFHCIEGLKESFIKSHNPSTVPWMLDYSVACDKHRLTKPTRKVEPVIVTVLGKCANTEKVFVIVGFLGQYKRIDE